MWIILVETYRYICTLLFTNVQLPRHLNWETLVWRTYQVISHLCDLFLLIEHETHTRFDWSLLNRNFVYIWDLSVDDHFLWIHVASVYHIRKCFPFNDLANLGRGNEIYMYIGLGHRKVRALCFWCCLNRAHNFIFQFIR